MSHRIEKFIKIFKKKLAILNNESIFRHMKGGALAAHRSGDQAMGNLVKEMIERVIEARGTNKNFPCKTYATENAAEKATAKAADNTGKYFAKNENDYRPANYLVIYVPQWDRWIGAINQSEVLRRVESTGGYLGQEPGFFKW